MKVCKSKGATERGGERGGGGGVSVPWPFVLMLGLLQRGGGVWGGGTEMKII